MLGIIVDMNAFVKLGKNLKKIARSAKTELLT